MDESVVPPAEQHEVVQVCCPPESPTVEMVNLKERGPAASRRLTVVVPIFDLATEPPWHRATLTPDADRLAITVDRRLDRSVASQHLGEF